MDADGRGFLFGSAVRLDFLPRCGVWLVLKRVGCGRSYDQADAGCACSAFFSRWYRPQAWA